MNQNKKIPFSPPSFNEKEIHEVLEVLRSGWITTGPKTKLFEQKITEYCKCNKTLCVSSATAGLEMILRWFGVKAGDEVIVPAYTYCATANVVEHCGAKSIMVDINKDDFNISVEAIQKAITEKTKVIMPVDIGGYPCDYNEIYQLFEDEKIKNAFSPENEIQKKLGRILIISDAAHSIGARYNNKMIGSVADVSVFSFHAVKNITTAEGGAIVLNLPEPFSNDDIYRYLNTMSLHGQTKDALAKTNKAGWKYDVIGAGYKANMTDIAAVLGIGQLERYQEILKHRKYIFETYSEAFNRYKWAILPVYQNNIKSSSCHLYMLRIKGVTEEKRDEIINKINNNGVSVNVHYQPLPMLSYYKAKGYNMNDYPLAFENYSCEITLPVHYALTDDQLDKVIKTVVEQVENADIKRVD